MSIRNDRISPHLRMTLILQLTRVTRFCCVQKGILNILLVIVLILITLQFSLKPLFFNNYELLFFNSSSNVKDISLAVLGNYFANEKLNSTNDSLHNAVMFDLSSSKYSISDEVQTDKAKMELPLCPHYPPTLVGEIKVEFTVPPLDVQEKLHPELELGGKFRPKNCRSRHRVALIIPFRDREEHLPIFMYHIHKVLQHQLIDYTIFIVEQAGKEEFNRAMLMNAGSLEAIKRYPFQCFIFHDVDLLPEDDRNLYTCPINPRHMSVAVDSLHYRLPYKTIFGGVSALTVEQFMTVNGFSNKYWGWGGEDDDMYNRIIYHGLNISRYPAKIARYKMITHKIEPPNSERFKNLEYGKTRFNTDGLNTIKYKVLDIKLHRLYTWIYVGLHRNSA